MNIVESKKLANTPNLSNDIDISAVTAWLNTHLWLWVVTKCCFIFTIVPCMFSREDRGRSLWPRDSTHQLTHQKSQCHRLPERPVYKYDEARFGWKTNEEKPWCCIQIPLAATKDEATDIQVHSFYLCPIISANQYYRPILAHYLKSVKSLVVFSSDNEILIMKCLGLAQMMWM